MPPHTHERTDDQRGNAGLVAFANRRTTGATMSLSSTSPVSAAMLAWVLLISVGVVSGVAPGARNASLMCNLNASAAVDYLTGKHLRVVSRTPWARVHDVARAHAAPGGRCTRRCAFAHAAAPFAWTGVYGRGVRAPES